MAATLADNPNAARLLRRAHPGLIDQGGALPIEDEAFEAEVERGAVQVKKFGPPTSASVDAVSIELTGKRVD